jgi:hypothetical protein
VRWSFSGRFGFILPQAERIKHVRLQFGNPLELDFQLTRHGDLARRQFFKFSRQPLEFRTRRTISHGVSPCGCQVQRQPIVMLPTSWRQGDGE